MTLLRPASGRRYALSPHLTIHSPTVSSHIAFALVPSDLRADGRHHQVYRRHRECRPSGSLAAAALTASFAATRIAAAAQATLPQLSSQAIAAAAHSATHAAVAASHAAVAAALASHSTASRSVQLLVQPVVLLSVLVPGLRPAHLRGSRRTRVRSLVFGAHVHQLAVRGLLGVWWTGALSMRLRKWTLACCSSWVLCGLVCAVE